MSLPRDTDSEDCTAAVPGVSILGDDAPAARPVVLPPEDEDGGATAGAAIAGDGTGNCSVLEDATDLEAEGALDEVFVYREGVVVPMDVNRIVVDTSVRVLPRHVFDGRHQLKEVALPEGLQEIEEEAFRNCISLECIHCPSTARISNKAFWGCILLKEVTRWRDYKKSGEDAEDALGDFFVYKEGTVVPMDVNSVIVDASVRILPQEVFDGRHQLKEVVLPEGLLEIGELAFRNCISLECIHYPSTLVRIGRGAFSGCTSLKEVVFLEGLLEIGAWAFAGCELLKEMELPSTLATISDGAFLRCSSLRDVVLPEGMQEIGNKVFASCLSLERAVFPSTLRKIGMFAFGLCISLKKVTLCEGVQEIRYGAFLGCISVLRINIPSSVTEIDEAAFNECTLMINVTISSSFTQDMLEKFTTLDHSGVSLDTLINRFDGLPIHRMIYFCQRTGTDSLIQLKQQVIRHGAGTFNCQDCLGMTPLHILTCGGTPDFELCKFLIETCPGALTIEDGWGQTPLNYVFLSEAPLDVVNLLLDTHRAMWGQMPFDFGDVVQRLAEKGGTSGEFIQGVIRAQRKYFPDVDVDWGRIVDEADWGKIDDSFADAASRKILMRPFRVLVEVSISTRKTCMSLKHKVEVDNTISGMGRLESKEEAAEERAQLRQLIVNHAQSY